MSKMGCLCGAVISDGKYPNATEGSAVRERDEDDFKSKFPVVVDDFLLACRDNQRGRWLSERFGSQYPQDLSDGEIIVDLMTSLLADVTLSMAECTACGRLWIQQQPLRNEYSSYSPDAPAHRGILDRQRRA